MPTTVIRNADWVIAWDEAVGRHVYRRGIDLAFADGRIAFLGKGYSGAADRVIDGARLMVMPGLIDIHSHPHHDLPRHSRGARRRQYAHDRALRARPSLYADR